MFSMFFDCFHKSFLTILLTEPPKDPDDQGEVVPGGGERVPGVFVSTVLYHKSINQSINQSTRMLKECLECLLQRCCII